MCFHDEEFISGKMGIIITALLSHQIAVGSKETLHARAFCKLLIAL